jgi:uncharacterized lipoprotein YajG
MTKDSKIEKTKLKNGIMKFTALLVVVILFSGCASASFSYAKPSLPPIVIHKPIIDNVVRSSL